MKAEFKSRIAKAVVPLLSILTIVMAVPTVTSAYAKQLERQDFSDGQSIGAFMTMIPAPSPLEKSLQTAPSSHSFITRTLIKTSKENTSLLWSMYPASVRGRTFGATGGNPMSGGW
jgi:hypothetical protein